MSKVEALTPLLLVRPCPKEDESRGGYLQRLAYLNGFPRSRDILEIVNATYSEFVERPLADMHRLISGQRLEKISGRTRRGVFTRRARVCPVCLAGHSYRKSIWDFPLQWICDKHNVSLVEACDTCSAPVRHDRGNLFFCVCGRDRRDVATSPVPEWMSSLEERFFPWRRAAGLLKSEQHAEEELSVARVIRVLINFGGAGVLRSDKHFPWRVWISLEEAANLGKIAKGEDGLTDHIREICSLMDRAQLMAFRTFVAHMPQCDALVAIQRGVYRPRKRSEDHSLHDVGLVRLSHCYRLLSLKPSIGHRLFDAGAFERCTVTKTEDGRIRRWIDAEEVRRYQDHINATVSFENAADRLGVDRARLRALTSAGLLKGVRYEGKTKTIRYELKEIIALFNRLSHGCKQTKRISGLVKLSELYPSRRDKLNRWISVVLAIQDGKIAARKTLGGEKLSNIGISLTEADKYVRGISSAQKREHMLRRYRGQPE